MLSVIGGVPPASSIFIIIEVPERGSPDTTVIYELALPAQPTKEILLPSPAHLGIANNPLFPGML
jgi:hypothetical protein